MIYVVWNNNREHAAMLYVGLESNDLNQMVALGQSHLQESTWQFSDCLVFTDMRFVKSFTQAYFLTFRNLTEENA